jgi:hypothetical protein
MPTPVSYSVYRTWAILVPGPPNPSTRSISGASHGGYRIGLLQTAQCVVVAKAERRHAPLALILAELKWLQRKRCDALDQIPFDRRRNEFSGVSQPLGSVRLVGK